MGHLDGKVAIVTGAGRLRGIGRATAVALASDGADVVVTGTGRDPASYPDDEKQAGWKDVESTAQQIRERGRRALTWVGDVSRAASVDDLVGRVMSTFGRIDVLVNNAAYPRGNDRVPLTELDETVWRRVLEIKLTGAYLLCKRIVPIMVAQRSGHIVNLSSVAGKRGSPNTAAYNVANFGIQGLTQSLAMEVARHGITVNAVCPGYIATEMVKKIPQDVLDKSILPYIPLGRLGEPEEIARCVLFLASDEAGLITGSTLSANGGQFMV